MANCKVRSYKAKGGMVRWLVNRRSKPHWHTEFQFSKRYDNISFSSTMQGKPKGCRFKQIAYSHPERWTTHEIKLTNAQEDSSWQWAQAFEGRKYDLWGRLSFGTKWRIIKPNRDKLWCTEMVCELLQVKYPDLIGFVPVLIPDQMHPQGLVEYLDER